MFNNKLYKTLNRTQKDLVASFIITNGIDCSKKNNIEALNVFMRALKV